MNHPLNKEKIVMAVEVSIIEMVTIASRMAVNITAAEVDMVVASSGLAETPTTVMIAISIMMVPGRTKEEEMAAATAEVKAMGTATTAIIVISHVVEAATIIEVDINAPGAAAAEDKAEASREASHEAGEAAGAVKLAVLEEASFESC